MRNQITLYISKKIAQHTEGYVTVTTQTKIIIQPCSGDADQRKIDIDKRVEPEDTFLELEDAFDESFTNQYSSTFSADIIPKDLATEAGMTFEMKGSCTILSKSHIRGFTRTTVSEVSEKLAFSLQ